MISSLTAEKLACTRGDKKLFDGLSFRVKAGQALAVEGANGAGKTSLLRMIAGFLAPVAGRIVVRIAEQESEDAEERGKSVGWLGHQDGLKPQLTVADLASQRARLSRQSQCATQQFQRLIALDPQVVRLFFVSLRNGLDTRDESGCGIARPRRLSHCATSAS